MKEILKILIALSAIALLCQCSSGRKMISLKKADFHHDLTLPGYSPDDEGARAADSIVVQDQLGNEVVLMNTITDQETGEDLATETIQAAVVTARFKSVAERHGHIDLKFDIHVPDTIIDKRWRIKLTPRLYMIGSDHNAYDSTNLDLVYITGEKFRSVQLRGYERYDNFVNSIVKDTSIFINKFLLERYISRFIPEIYKFRNDTSYVTEEVFTAAFGNVTEEMAVWHYTNKLRRAINNYKIDIKPKVFDICVRHPIEVIGVRLDTVVQEHSGEFVYTYTQRVRTKPRLKKLQLFLDGNVTDNTSRIYTMARPDSLEYNISSLIHFADPDVVKYTTQVISRRFTTTAEYPLDFDSGDLYINPARGNNASVLDSIRRDIKSYANNPEVRLTGIDVNVSHSPQGNWAINNISTRTLAQTLAAHLQGSTGGTAEGISFTTGNTAENWDMLDRLVDAAPRGDLSETDLVNYWMIRSDLTPDNRESGIAEKPVLAAYLGERLYPCLNFARIEFTLERKAMTKDTIHIVRVDTTYARGLEYLMDGEYAKAVEVLREYPEDYNAGMAFLATDRNQNAVRTFESLPKTPIVNYMLAVSYSRLGEYSKAVQNLLDAVAGDPKLRNRGNLDPEISKLIKSYNLFQESEPELE